MTESFIRFFFWIFENLVICVNISLCHNVSHPVLISEMASMMIMPVPDMTGFFQHLTFHLWLFLPLFLLFVPSEPKFVDNCVQNLLLRRKSQPDSRYEWQSGKLRMPLFTTFLLSMSALWGLLWALLHLHSNVVRYYSFIKSELKSFESKNNHFNEF